MASEQRPCTGDPFAIYDTSYEALLAAADRDVFVREQRVTHRCCRIAADCALAQALADVERRVPKRSKAHFLWTMAQIQDQGSGI